MTTGSKTIGSTNSPYYYFKNWDGTDGKYINPSNFDRGISNLKFNPYTATIVEEKKKPGPTGLFPFRVAWPSDPWTSNDSVRLQSRIVSQVKGHQFQLGVAVAEGKQTMNLVVGSIKKIGLALRDLRHGHFEKAARRLGVPKHRVGVFKDIKQGKRTVKGRFFRYSSDFDDKILKETFPPNQLTSKDISAMWLELQYGWKPLLNDVFASMDAYHALTEQPRRIVYRATNYHRPNVTFSQSDVNIDYVGEVISSHSYMYIATERMSGVRSLGLLDPLSIVWEVVPFSFVLDWFIPIGTYFENLNAIPNLDGTFVATNKLWRIQTGTNRAGKPGFQAAFWAGSGMTASDFTYVRTVSSALPPAKPVFKSLDEALSPLHVWNALALAHQGVVIH